MGDIVTLPRSSAANERPLALGPAYQRRAYVSALQALVPQIGCDEREIAPQIFAAAAEFYGTFLASDEELARALERFAAAVRDRMGSPPCPPDAA